ncbi:MULTISPECIES: glycosyltransferase [unclassified Halomonas]|uniref:glycosyltransferase n=1 Tax=unclassified Halomonas TaxID=2609666 RepID=UPI0028838A55|nr:MULTISPECIES: glycosyltransferase [unclassified Halomonas]MDT0500563.1 glycosyltransferase [Halomonas sp. PAR7]MDT0511541.1 glycosyltransferase [Halomonas sp. LES1]MDT0590171.1 glycosyltransferase [Halomonas sp. PAR8]
MRILFAAGTQFAFPRMGQVVLEVSRQRPSWPLVYQAGPGASLHRFSSLSNLQAQPLFAAELYQRLFAEADLVVTHAGMGNILACLEQGKPFLMLPRQARLGEHRNDHQVDTAEAINERFCIPIHEDVDSLVRSILSYDALSATAVDGDAILRRRKIFGKKLNALIGSL